MPVDRGVRKIGGGQTVTTSKATTTWQSSARLLPMLLNLFNFRLLELLET